MLEYSFFDKRYLQEVRKYILPSGKEMIVSSLDKKKPFQKLLRKLIYKTAVTSEKPLPRAALGAYGAATLPFPMTASVPALGIAMSPGGRRIVVDLAHRDFKHIPKSIKTGKKLAQLKSDQRTDKLWKFLQKHPQIADATTKGLEFRYNMNPLFIPFN